MTVLAIIGHDHRGDSPGTVARACAVGGRATALGGPGFGNGRNRRGSGRFLPRSAAIRIDSLRAHGKITCMTVAPRPGKSRFSVKKQVSPT